MVVPVVMNSMTHVGDRRGVGGATSMKTHATRGPAAMPMMIHVGERRGAGDVTNMTIRAVRDPAATNSMTVGAADVGRAMNLAMGVVVRGRGAMSTTIHVARGPVVTSMARSVAAAHPSGKTKIMGRVCQRAFTMPSPDVAAPCAPPMLPGVGPLPCPSLKRKAPLDGCSWSSLAWSSWPGLWEQG